MIILTIIIIIGLASLSINNNSTLESNATYIESLETFSVNCGNLTKGKNITWDWMVEKNLNNLPDEINFWIEDSQGNKNYEIRNYKNKGSFIVPSTDEWNLKWENPSYIDESCSSSIGLKYKIEIVNQVPTASIKVNKTSGYAPLTISFTGTGLDYDGEVISYHWYFGDEDTINEQNPTYTFSNIGTYIITLIVTDNDGANGENSVKIIVH